jgi:hypothetical protein
MGTTATGTAQVVGIESAPSGSPFQTLDFSLTLDGTFGASQYFHYSFANVCLADQSLSQGSRLEVQVWQQSTSGTTAFPNSQISSPANSIRTLFLRLFSGKNIFSRACLTRSVQCLVDGL